MKKKKRYIINDRILNSVRICICMCVWVGVQFHRLFLFLFLLLFFFKIKIRKIVRIFFALTVQNIVLKRTVVPCMLSYCIYYFLGFYLSLSLSFALYLSCFFLSPRNTSLPMFRPPLCILWIVILFLVALQK